MRLIIEHHEQKKQSIFVNMLNLLYTIYHSGFYCCYLSWLPRITCGVSTTLCRHWNNDLQWTHLDHCWLVAQPSHFPGDPVSVVWHSSEHSWNIFRIWWTCIGSNASLTPLTILLTHQWATRITLKWQGGKTWSMTSYTTVEIGWVWQL